MYSLLLENSIKELTAGDLECVGPDEFLEVPLPPHLPHPSLGQREQGQMTGTENSPQSPQS